MRVKIKRNLVILFFFYCTLAGSSNEQIGSYMNEYYEILTLAGIIDRPALIYHSLSRNAWQLPPAVVDHPWKLRMEREKDWNRSEGANWNIISPELLLSYNTRYAQGSNDGLFWQGRGINSKISGGVNLSWDWISITLAPELWFAQNQSFSLMPPNPLLSEFSYPGGNIDMPQRFGSDPMFGHGFGQSDLRFNIRWFTFGLSNENLWFGPAQINPIIMSNNASGFPHADIGTRKVKTFLGDIEFNLVWGALIESDYFDEDESNNYRLFTALTFGFCPFFIEGLVLGLTRVMTTHWEDLSLYDFVRLLDPRLTGAGSDHPGYDDRDQMASLVIDWFLPAAQFGVYLEWARSDFSPDIRSALLFPQHSQGYTLGLRKVLATKRKKFVVITAELTELAGPNESNDKLDTLAPFYQHGNVIQGYTHLGQVMGAAIGPGSNGQFLGVTYYDYWGKASVFFQRVAYDQDYYIENFTAPGNENVRLLGGVSGTIFLSPIDLSFKLVLVQNLNHNYVYLTDRRNRYFAVSCRYIF